MTGFIQVAIVLMVMLVAVIVLAAITLAILLKVKQGFDTRDVRIEAGEDALDRANDALEAAHAALNNIATTLNTVMTQIATGSAIEQQHYEGLQRGFDQTEARMEKMRETVDGQLDTIRATVDEKLMSTLNDRLGASFKQVSEQLEAVYKGLGEMQTVAGGVKDLKRVLSNVKTRGILGEVQLGAILADILAPDQYAENIATKPGSAERVEFAVKLPVEGGEPIWLPIDSKFPGDTYEHLRDAIAAGDADAITSARKALDQVIRQEARDISEKYLCVPETTNFGIMFLPFEGLYAEVVDRPGLIECLQRDYQVSVAGPSTMAAILNSLQMSYQTFAFQRQADAIQKVLSAVKAEFPKYQAELRRALKQIETAGKTVDSIINTRTNVIERKLRDVIAMEDDAEAAELLGLDTPVGKAESDQEE